MAKALWLVAIVGVGAWALPLGFESGPHWLITSPTSLTSFTQLANQAITFGNDLYSASIGLLPAISGGLGLRMAETVGGDLALGVSISLFEMGSATEGIWGEEEVSIALSTSYFDLQLSLSFSPVPGLLTLGAGAGLGTATVGYSGKFPQTLPAGWTLPYTPPQMEGEFRGRAPVGAVWMRVSIPALPVLTVGLEAGLRWARFPSLSAGERPLDLNEDGTPDALDLSGFWIGLNLKVLLDI